MSAIAILYFESITKSYAAAALVFSIWMFTQSVMELPTGVISDKWSRRKTLITSAALQICSGLCFAIAGNIGDADLLFAGAVFWGMAEAFNSGTEEALIYETAANMRKTESYDMIYSGTKIFRYAGAATATVIAVPTLYFFGMNALAWVSILPAAAQTIVSAYFVEPRGREKNAANPMRHFISAFSKWIRNARIRKLVLAHAMSLSCGEPTYRMSSIYAAMFLPIWAIDFAVFVQRVCGAVGFYAAIFMRRLGLLRMAFLASAFKCLCMFCALLADCVVSPFLIAGVTLGNGGEAAAQTGLLQKEFAAAERATMQNIGAIFAGLLASMSVYVFGMIADAWSVYAALAALLAYRSIISLYYRYLMLNWK